MTPDRMIRGILFLSCLFVCLFVCLSVCLLSTLTFAITFEPLEVETSYLACILHLWSPFKWHQGQWPCDLDFDLCSKNSFFWLRCHRGHSQCFTNTPWFWILKLVKMNTTYCILHMFIMRSSKLFVITGTTCCSVWLTNSVMLCWIWEIGWTSH